MARLPQISGKEMGQALSRIGFVFVSQRGSHMKFVCKHDSGKEIMVVPNHAILRKGTLNDIIKKLNLSVEEFKKFL